jgi:hypothetical protein
MTTPDDPGDMAAEEAAYRTHHAAELAESTTTTTFDLKAFLAPLIATWQDRTAAAFLRDDILICRNKLSAYLWVWENAFPDEPYPTNDHTRHTESQ